MSDTRFLFLFFAWNDRCYWIDSEILLSKVLSIGSAGLFCWHLRENLSLRAEYHSGLKLSRGIQSVKTETLEIISPCSRVVRGIEVVKFLRQASLSFDISGRGKRFFSFQRLQEWPKQLLNTFLGRDFVIYPRESISSLVRWLYRIRWKYLLGWVQREYLVQYRIRYALSVYCKSVMPKNG